jgi:hypothetical protein
MGAGVNVPAGWGGRGAGVNITGGWGSSGDTAGGWGNMGSRVEYTCRVREHG